MHSHPPSPEQIYKKEVKETRGGRSGIVMLRGHRETKHVRGGIGASRTGENWKGSCEELPGEGSWKGFLDACVIVCITEGLVSKGLLDLFDLEAACPDFGKSSQDYDRNQAA